MGKPGGFQKLASATAHWVGTPWAFGIALLVIVSWAVSGPMFGFSETWQLVINTGTTIVTFLMVFLIQATQNRDAKALHLKLDELIRATKARNVFADLEEATDEELEAFQREFQELRAQGLRHTDAVKEAHERVLGDDDDGDDAKDDAKGDAEVRA